MNVLKSTSSNYVQNMIENMVLTSYLDKSYFVASKGGYVASIQMMSRDKLKHQVRGQILSRDITFMSHRWLRYTMTAKTSKCCNRCIFSLTTCEVLRHAVAFFLHSGCSGVL